MAVEFLSAAAGNRFLAVDGQEIVLAGIWTPAGEASGYTSAGVLTSLLTGKRMTLAQADTGAPDRYGRRVAYAFANESSVQMQLVSAGAALAAPDLSSARCARLLLSAEDTARRTKSGHWGDGQFEILSVDRLTLEAARRAGTFQIFEGKIEAAAVVRGRAYLNFGIDRRTDLTVTIAPPDMRAFRRARIDVRALAAKRVRARGWLELYNGPEISLSVPGALEVLE